MKTLLSLIAAGMALGCAQKPLSAPSSVAVDTGIGNVGTHVKTAQQHNDEAVVHNAKAMTAVERIDAKAAVLQKYWHHEKNSTNP